MFSKLSVIDIYKYVQGGLVLATSIIVSVVYWNIKQMKMKKVH